MNRLVIAFVFHLREISYSRLFSNGHLGRNAIESFIAAASTALDKIIRVNSLFGGVVSECMAAAPIVILYCMKIHAVLPRQINTKAGAPSKESNIDERAPIPDNNCVV